MPGWDALLGVGSAAEQLFVWQVAGQVVSTLLGPTFDLLAQEINADHPTAILSPADLADAVVRGIKDQTSAAAEAAKGGIDGDRFTELVLGAGEPPGLETVLQMFRRKYIPWADAGPTAPSVERAIKTSRVYDYWSGPIQANADIPISVGEAVNALLRGQTDQTTALTEAEANGINAARFQILLDSAGRPPAPGELMELMRRNLIPKEGVGPTVTSFQQGIYEGDSKDKWWTLLADLATYIPPPRTVTTLLKTGSISDADAQGYWQDAGITPDLSAAYAKSARGEKLAGSKQLAEGTVLTLYEAQAIDTATATAYLGALGYDGADAALMLGLADVKREVKYLDSAISKVHSLYEAHKITRAGAAEALTALGVTGDHQTHVLRTWDVELTANVKQLTEAQIATAYEYGNMTEAEALTELQLIGYTPFDSWVLLSNKNKGPLPNRPAPGPTPPGVLP